MSNELQINDAVHVKLEETLEGAIAYINRQDDVVGVRLMDKSIDKGNCNGIYKDKRYFSTGENGAIFVNRNRIQKRDLTRFELLKLKREILKLEKISSLEPPSSQSDSTPNSSSIASKRTSSESARRLSSEKSASSRISMNRTSTPESIKIENKNIESSSVRRSSRLSMDLTPEPSKIEDKKVESTTRRKSNIPTPSSETRSISSTKSINSGIKPTTRRTSIEKQPERKDDEIKSLGHALKQTNQEKEQIQDELTTIKASLLLLLETFSTSNDDELLAASSFDSSSSKQDSTVSLITKLQKIIEETVHEKSLLSSKVYTLEHEMKSTKSEYELKIDSLSSELNRSKEIYALLEDQNKVKSQNTNIKEDKDTIKSLQDRIQTLESSKLDTDSILEHITLEKEQLLEEKEMLQDKIEELKIDLESVQLELEELKLELDDKSNDTLPTKSEIHKDIEGDDDIILQNTRLRDALVILRDEKIDLEHKLKEAKSHSASKDAIEQELKDVKLHKEKLEVEIQELKEMVDEGSAYEKMVEELTDRALLLESEINKHKATIKEMEEAADIATETEEELFLENKTLVSTIENKDSTIQTLHEAIKIQRDREEQLHIEINKYRNTIELLKHEKTMLLNMHHGEEGAKNTLIATSQKALDRVAKLVQDVGELRKKDSMAVFDKVNLMVISRRCERLEAFLPNNVGMDEIGILKGETMLNKIATLAGVALSCIDSNFDAIFSKNDFITANTDADDNPALIFTDEAMHQLKCILNETEFARSLINIQSEVYRVLCAFQWPELLTLECSSKLATALLHPLTSVDLTLGNLLKLYIQEKSLNPKLCDLAPLSESMNDTKMAIIELTDSDKIILPQDWNPPGLNVICNLYGCKFIAFGSIASLVSALCTVVENDPSNKNILESKLGILKQLTDEVINGMKSISTQIVNLDFQDSNLVSVLFEHALDLENTSNDLFNLLVSTDSTSNVWNLITKCISQLRIVLDSIEKISKFMSENLVNTKKQLIMPLIAKTSEPSNVWENVIGYIGDFTNVDRGSMNYQKWARNVREDIIKAFSNNSKLVVSTEKILELEKSLSSRSKEVSLLNTRVDELLKLLAQAERKDSTSLSVDGESFNEMQEEVKKLKKENQTLHEAIEISHQKTEKNQREIQLLKDCTQRNTPGKLQTPRHISHSEFKVSASIEKQMRSPSTDAKNKFASPVPSTSMNKSALTTPRRSQSLIEFDTSSKLSTPAKSINELNTSNIHLANSISLEAAYFRPLLQAARREMEHWKGEAIRKSLSNMEPLDLPHDLFINANAINQGGEIIYRTTPSGKSNLMNESKEELRLAIHKLRMTKICMKVPDIKKDLPLRAQFQVEQLKMKNALNRLEEVSKRVNVCLVQHGM